MTHREAKSKVVSFTDTVKRMIYDIPKIELSKKLGIGRGTLDRRLRDHTWTYQDYLIINELNGNDGK